MLKKLLIVPFALAAVFTFGSTADAAGTSATTSNVSGYEYLTISSAQVRVRYQYRTVQRGRRIFRETYRVSRYRNGRVVRQLVSRTRIR